MAGFYTDEEGEVHPIRNSPGYKPSEDQRRRSGRERRRERREQRKQKRTAQTQPLPEPPKLTRQQQRELTAAKKAE